MIHRPPVSRKITLPDSGSSKQQIWEYYLTLSNEDRENLTNLVLTSPQERQEDESAELYLIRMNVMRTLYKSLKLVYDRQGSETNLDPIGEAKENEPVPPTV